MTSTERRLVGLIGANIMKSLAPAVHEDQYAAAGLHGHYHLMDLDHLPGRSLEQVFAGAKAVGFSGVNITFPVKQAIMPLLDEISAEARQIGAVNTVTIGLDGATIGYNTDCSGFRRSFVESLGQASVGGRKAVLVGAGGAGRAVAFALKDLGAELVMIHDVDMSKATGLVADLERYGGRAMVLSATELAAGIGEAAGVVNATPIGMLGFPGMPVPPALLRRDHWLVDVIYTPIKTELLKAAEAKGCRVLTGGGMNVHQAADAFRLFTGREPDVERIRRTFARALAERDAALAATKVESR